MMEKGRHNVLTVSDYVDVPRATRVGAWHLVPPQVGIEDTASVLKARRFPRRLLRQVLVVRRGLHKDARELACPVVPGTVYFEERGKRRNVLALGGLFAMSKKIHDYILHPCGSAFGIRTNEYVCVPKL